MIRSMSNRCKVKQTHHNGNLQKRIEDETEQLERSGLTKEHGQAVCSPNVSYLSDSTQKSNKRKRETSPSSDISNHGEF